MAEYIKREAAIDAITDLAGKASTRSAYEAVWKSARALKKLPATDVAPVVHGRWLKPHWALGRQRVCSVCHNTVRMPSFDSGEYTEYPGCPWCLAKMDGGAE